MRLVSIGMKQFVCRAFTAIGAVTAPGVAMAIGGIAPTIQWARQLGTVQSDYSYGVSADRLGNVFISGFSDGALGGANTRSTDAFVSRYDALGNLYWTRKLGTTATDVSHGVSADHSGNVYVTGTTSGNLGMASAGLSDAFVSKFDLTGDLQWTRQLGVSSYDSSWSVSADALGGVYITGGTEGSLGGPNAGGEDAYLSKYDAGGNLQWTRQLGTGGTDRSIGVSADGLGSVYISGNTNGSLRRRNAGGHDAFLSKFDAAGNLTWTRQFGSSGTDISNGVSADALGNVFVTGYTTEVLGGSNAGGYDAFVSKFDATGNVIWTRQFGSSGYDESFAVAADGSGNAYVSGRTNGAIDGTSFGQTDAFVGKFDSTGERLWLQHLGTDGDDYGHGVSTGRLGEVYVSGPTDRGLGGPHVGNWDSFLVKISDVPEPASAMLMAVGLLLMRKFPTTAQGR